MVVKRLSLLECFSEQFLKEAKIDKKDRHFLYLNSTFVAVSKGEVVGVVSTSVRFNKLYLDRFYFRSIRANLKSAYKLLKIALEPFRDRFRVYYFEVEHTNESIKDNWYKNSKKITQDKTKITYRRDL